MKDGRIIADGPPREMVTPAVIGEVFDIDVPVHQVEGRPLAVYFALGQQPAEQVRVPAALAES